MCPLGAVRTRRRAVFCRASLSVKTAAPRGSFLVLLLALGIPGTQRLLLFIAPRLDARYRQGMHMTGTVMLAFGTLAMSPPATCASAIINTCTLFIGASPKSRTHNRPRWRQRCWPRTETPGEIAAQQRHRDHDPKLLSRGRDTGRDHSASCAAATFGDTACCPLSEPPRPPWRPP